MQARARWLVPATDGPIVIGNPFTQWVGESEALTLNNGGNPANGTQLSDTSASGGSVIQLINGSRTGPGMNLPPGNYVYVVRLKTNGVPASNPSVTLRVRSGSTVVATLQVWAHELAPVGSWHIKHLPFVLDAPSTSLSVETENLNNNTGFTVSEDYALILPDGGVERPCRDGFWPVADGRLCVESGSLRAPANAHTAIGVCKSAGAGGRVCTHTDMQQACASGVSPYGATNGWYGNHGGADNHYMTWNVNGCGNDNDGVPTASGAVLPYRCCY